MWHGRLARASKKQHGRGARATGFETIMGTISNSAHSYFNEMSVLLGKLDMAPIERLAELLFECWRDRRRVYVFGNGGSAATAGHYVADFVKTASVEGQKRLMAFCLSDNTGLLTALGNDVA